ncbi:hypothetical protein PBY51_013861 [Eleginops maclovinus]|uniref:Uncharacterized protein n=1 Tax=Eleginops maclovinus TaxID=56733 RepID=A0AAN8ABV0_ELEMC|nr:hypothetical protein PBY51_013861 [Eleginops maclovinus]
MLHTVVSVRVTPLKVCSSLTPLLSRCLQVFLPEGKIFRSSQVIRSSSTRQITKEETLIEIQRRRSPHPDVTPLCRQE